jgi:hypothetical protein
MDNKLQTGILRGIDDRLTLMHHLYRIPGCQEEAVDPYQGDAMHAEAKCWERALKKALQERDEVLRDLVTAARWVDRSAFGPKEKGFG